MNDSLLDRVDGAIEILGLGQGLSGAISSLASLADSDLACVPESRRRQLARAVAAAALDEEGPLLVLSLPRNLQAEVALFAPCAIPGVDRTAVLRATPDQVVRMLSEPPSGNGAGEVLCENYDFARFRKEDWDAYFSRCPDLFQAARSFSARGEADGALHKAKALGALLRNPSFIPSVPHERMSPDVAVSLLISGRADALWKSYDLSTLTKGHWRRLLSHANLGFLPEACRPFVENKDGRGFTDAELLELARKCPQLTDFLNPDKVPFNVAYELFQTGKADVLWEKYPFASLDKSEWRMLLDNPCVNIPGIFLDMAREGRFSIEELCRFALKNDRMLPILCELGVPAEKLIDVLLSSKSDYLWEHCDFGTLSPDDWVRLVRGLKDGEILRPRALAAFDVCKGLAASHVSLILEKDLAYCPHVPVAAVPPDVAVEILVKGEGQCLWATYDFKRLNADQWLRLLGWTTHEVPAEGRTFLRERAKDVDGDYLNLILARRESLVRYVDADLVNPQFAAALFAREPAHELWNRYDFSRFSGKQIADILKTTRRSRDWPATLRAFFEEDGALALSDLLGIAIANPVVAIQLVSCKRLACMDDGAFLKFIQFASRDWIGHEALWNRMRAGKDSWRDLPICKLKILLIADPSMRALVKWKKWPRSVIREMAYACDAFEEGLPHRRPPSEHRDAWVCLLLALALGAVVLIGNCTKKESRPVDTTRLPTKLDGKLLEERLWKETLKHIEFAPGMNAPSGSSGEFLRLKGPQSKKRGDAEKTAASRKRVEDKRRSLKAENRTRPKAETPPDGER